MSACDIQCPNCHHFLLRESLPMHYKGVRVNQGERTKRYNLHCLYCDHYFVEDWEERNYYSFMATMREGKSIRKTRSMRDAEIVRRALPELSNTAPYCLIRTHKPIPIPRDFHEMWLRLREEQKKKLTT